MTNIININLDNIIHNFAYFKNILDKNKKIYPVIKGNAYNIGISIIIKLLNKEFNCENFFIYSLDEAIFLKKQFNNFNFYPLGGIKINQEKIFFDNNIIPIINSLEQLERVYINSEIIIQFNTGMNRNGINISEINKCLDIIKQNNLKIKFIMTHLACANDKNHKMALQQLNNFKLISKYFPNIEKSISATDGILNINNNDLYDIVRLGGGMYGFNYGDKLKNIFSLISKIKSKNNIFYLDFGRNNGIFKDFNKSGFVLYNNKKIKIKKITKNKIILDIKKHKNKFCLVCGEYKNQFIDINTVSKNMGLIPYEFQVRLLQNLSKNNKFKVNYYYKNEKIDIKYQNIPVVYESKNIITKNQIISSIIEIRKVEEGGWIGYGAKYEVKKGDCVATFDVGYINGISRKVKQKYVYVERNDKTFCKCKIIGNISMDQTTILLENINDFSVGNKVIIAKNKKYIKKYKDIFFMKDNRNCIFIK